MRTFDLPVIINCRDRVTPLRALVRWLERAGHEHIYLLDNASTYEPLLDYYRETVHHVVRLNGNYGCRALWTTNIVRTDSWFVYTDPDCVPLEECPDDAVTFLHELLLRYPDQPKAGLGLYLDDAPRAPLEHELRLLQPNPPHWQGEIEPGVYDSWVDTTFALYRPGSEWVLPAIRTGYPYQCRHVSPSWYGGELTDEDRYYFDHAMPGPLYSGWKASHARR